MAAGNKTLFKFWMFLLVVALAWVVSNVAAAPAPAPEPGGDGDEDAENPKDEQWTWCVDNDQSLTICKQMNKVLDEIDPDKKHVHSCILGGDEECAKSISAGDAKFGIFDGGEIWEAYDEYNLMPIRTELSEIEGRYFGVAVVNTDKCPKSLSDLKGMRSCHTGYGRASGWVLPVSYLMQNKIMPVVTKDPSVPYDIQSVKSFFSKSCAADVDAKDSICTACKVTTNCNEEDLYYDYAGSFRCLVEGSGDVSFTKGIIPGQFSKGGILAATDWTNLKDASQYQILCPDAPEGKLCADVSSYKTCNFGSAPGHTIMVAKNFSQNEINEFHKVMDTANSNPDFISIFSSTNLTDNEFAAGASRSVRYNGTVQDLLGPLYPRITYLEQINTVKAGGGSGDGGNSSGAASLAAAMEKFVVAGVAIMVSMLAVIYF